MTTGGQSWKPRIKWCKTCKRSTTWNASRAIVNGIYVHADFLGDYEAPGTFGAISRGHLTPSEIENTSATLVDVLKCSFCGRSVLEKTKRF